MVMHECISVYPVQLRETHMEEQEKAYELKAKIIEVCSMSTSVPCIIF